MSNIFEHYLLLILLLFVFFQFSNATVKCYKGFSGDGRSFKQRLCQTEYCLKTTEANGGSTYGCDDFTPFCSKDECVTTAQKKEICCCKTELCNLNRSNNSIFIFFVTVIFLYCTAEFFS